MWRPGGWELIAILVLLLLMAIPIWLLWKIFGRAGLPKGYAFLILLPYVGPFIALAILAFSRWPAVDGVTPAVSAPVPGMPAAAVSPPPVVAPAAPAGWLPDPTGQHKLRYWDGTTWTDNVNDG